MITLGTDIQENGTTNTYTLATPSSVTELWVWLPLNEYSSQGTEHSATWSGNAAARR